MRIRLIGRSAVDGSPDIDEEMDYSDPRVAAASWRYRAVSVRMLQAITREQIDAALYAQAQEG